MKERPILFSAPMVRAILDGRKTQTRRAFSERTINLMRAAAKLGEVSHFIDEGILAKNDIGYVLDICPHGKIGDQLWVRETHHHCADKKYLIDEYQQGLISGEAIGLIYKADTPNLVICDGGWMPSIYMPRWASRILLEITDVRVERLNDISRTDAAAEGICYPDREKKPDWYRNDNWPEQNFAGLWQSINGDGSWQQNPWVWVIEFKRIDQ